MLITLHPEPDARVEQELHALDAPLVEQLVRQRRIEVVGHPDAAFEGAEGDAALLDGKRDELGDRFAVPRHHNLVALLDFGEELREMRLGLVDVDLPAGLHREIVD